MVKNLACEINITAFWQCRNAEKNTAQSQFFIGPTAYLNKNLYTALSSNQNSACWQTSYIVRV